MLINNTIYLFQREQELVKLIFYLMLEFDCLPLAVVDQLEVVSNEMNFFASNEFYLKSNVRSNLMYIKYSVAVNDK